MTRVSLRTFARLVTRRPGLSLLLAVVLTILAVASIRTRLKIEMDVASLLPEDSQVAQITNSALRDFGSFDFMFAVIEATEPGREEDVKALAAQLAEALDDQRFIRRIVWRLTPESLQIGTPQGDARAVAVLTDEDWAELEAKLKPEQIHRAMQRLRAMLNAPITGRQRDLLLRDPLNFNEVLLERVKIKSGPLKVNLRESYFMSEDRQMLLLLLWPVQPATDLKFAQEFRTFLEGTREGIFIRNPQWSHRDRPEGRAIKIHFYGAHYEAMANSELVQRDFMRTSVVSLCAVLVLFFVAFRRPEALVFIAIPLLAGVVWTLGIASLYPGRLTQVTMSFSAILIGLGVDFSVHLYNRYVEELRCGATNEKAVEVAVAETGPGIVAGALTTSIAFFGMMTTSFVGFREFGLLTGIGTLSCLAAVALILPPLLLATGRKGGGHRAQRPLTNLGLGRFYFTAINYPRVTLLVGLVICAYLGIYAREVRFEDDFRNLRQPSDEYVALRDRLESHFKIPSNQIVAILNAGNEQAALEANDQLFRNISATRVSYDLIAVDSLRYFIPAEATQRIQLERMTRQNLDELRAQIDVIAAEYRISPRAFDQFLVRLGEIKAAARGALDRNETPITLASLAPARDRALSRIAQRYLYKTEEGVWRVMTQVYPPEGEWISEVPTPFLDSLRMGIGVPMQVTGSAIIQQELRAIIVGDLAKTVLLVLALTFVYLLVYFERLGRALLAMVPVLVGLMCMLGIIHLTGMELHYLNIISLPMIVGIGVDSAIHLLQRYYEEEKRDLKKTLLRTGRAVVITGLTTIFGFGSLSLANFRGIRELGLFSILGVGLTLFASLLILPALLRLFEGRTRYSGGEGDDIG